MAEDKKEKKEEKKKKISKAELKRRIRSLTREVNFRYKVAKDTNTITPQMQKLISTAQSYGSKARDTRTQVVGLGFNKHGKDYGALMRQYRELKRIIKVDVWSPVGVSKRDLQDKEAWKAFNTKNKYDWDFDKWKSFVDTFGNIPTEILTAFHYSTKDRHDGSSTASIHTKKGDNNDLTNRSLLEAFNTAYDKRVDLLTLMTKVYENAEEGDTSMTLYDNLLDEIERNAK